MRHCPRPMVMVSDWSVVIGVVPANWNSCSHSREPWSCQRRRRSTCLARLLSSHHPSHRSIRTPEPASGTMVLPFPRAGWRTELAQKFESSHRARTKLNSVRIQTVARMRRCAPARGASAGQPRATNRSGRSARALLPIPRFVVGNCSAHARGLGSPFSQHAGRAGAYARQGRLARIPDVPGDLDISLSCRAAAQDRA